MAYTHRTKVPAGALFAKRAMMAALVLLLLASVAGCYRPKPVTMSVTLTSVKDATLYEDDAGALSNGAGENMFAGRKGTGHSVRALVAFDVAGKVPEGKTLSGVQLRLTLTAASSSDTQPLRLHRVLADWGEGATVAPGGGGGGGPVSPGGATWLHTFSPDQSWSQPGGDMEIAPSASVDVGGLAAYEWGSTDQMVADVKMWLDDPSSDHGWLLVGDDATAVKRFAARENANEAALPTLTLTFE